MFKQRTKKGREIPADATCRNCDAPALGRYCHICGQDIFAGEGRSLLSFIGNTLTIAFALDSKVLITLKYLFFKPGFLSSEYRLGRIVRYVRPVKLFWMSTLIFFALLFGTNNQNSKTTITISGQKASTQITEQPTAEGLTTVEPENTTAPAEKTEEQKGISSEQLNKYIIAFAPYIAFFLIPIFAFLLKLFFYRKKYFYMYHLTFAVHFHSFLWILCSFLLIPNLFSSGWDMPSWLELFFLLLPGAYLMIALYRFYQPKRKWSVIWKSIVVTLLYFAISIAFLIAVLMLIDLIWGIRSIK
jgi:hypothetical protein